MIITFLNTFILKIKKTIVIKNIKPINKSDTLLKKYSFIQLDTQLKFVI